jgi:hypothetical protein
MEIERTLIVVEQVNLQASRQQGRIGVLVFYITYAK